MLTDCIPTAMSPGYLEQVTQTHSPSAEAAPISQWHKMATNLFLESTELLPHYFFAILGQKLLDDNKLLMYE